MRDYFIRRFLLIPPTLLGITFIVFAITRAVPGGPLERALMEMQQLNATTGRSSAQMGQNQALSESQLQQLKAYYGFDKPWYQSYFIWLGKMVTGDFGRSTRYGEPVLETIVSRFPISLSYGLITLVITYAVCIPLGIVKAIGHRTAIDSVTSVLVFIGYAIPGYVLGALMVVYLAAKLGWFPLGGFTSYNFDDLGFFAKIGDFLHHAALPVFCYLVGSFAFLTLLMKNNLMENLAADYVRTAMAKGNSFRTAVFRHALRNSLIPIATNFGQNILLLVGGSFLIETIFDIDGFGLLGITSILDRDYPVVMGVLTLSALLLLLGNIISDMIVAFVDPRVRFN